MKVILCNTNNLNNGCFVEFNELDLMSKDKLPIWPSYLKVKAYNMYKIIECGLEYEKYCAHILFYYYL